MARAASRRAPSGASCATTSAPIWRASRRRARSGPRRWKGRARRWSSRASPWTCRRIPIGSTRGLMELTFGDWRGPHLGRGRGRRSGRTESARGGQVEFRPAGGESYAGAGRRVRPWLAERGGDSLVVSHGGVARAFIDDSRRNFRPPSPQGEEIAQGRRSCSSAATASGSAERAARRAQKRMSNLSRMSSDWPPMGTRGARTPSLERSGLRRVGGGRLHRLLHLHVMRGLLRHMMMVMMMHHRLGHRLCHRRVGLSGRGRVRRAACASAATGTNASAAVKP